MTRDRALHILGLPPGASTEEARAAFRKAVKQLHPDARGGVPADAFQRVLEAWRTIEAKTERPALRPHAERRPARQERRAGRRISAGELELGAVQGGAVPAPRGERGLCGACRTARLSLRRCL